ncbi:MAG: isochorismate synthase [Geodermatophilaceae bacterium]|nr:isochorismate synthase [Geodermatophilaceae bacterium]
MAVSIPPVAVRSVPIADPGDLLERLGPDAPLAWVRGGDGVVGWGETARLEVDGPDAVAQARRWWHDQLGQMVVEDRVGVRGSGPICFGSVAFDQRRSASVFVVPRAVIGRRDGVTWLTTMGPPSDLPPRSRPQGPGSIAYADGAISQAQWCAAVASAVRSIRAGELRKVVLARDLLAHTTPAVDPRFLLQHLAARYPECWTFAVDGLIGATPELLVSRTGREVTSLVLAGTVRWGSSHEDEQLIASMVASAKDQEEHVYSVRSVADALAPFCRRLDTPEHPEVLRLATVAHLATTVGGRLSADTDVLSLVDALHPPAAVCGTPTDVALDLIPELEGMDRGRYAGPVGWVDATGDGEWGIALRCAQVDGVSLRLFAGCGIVEGSVPEAELAETQAKLVTMRDALAGL